jgi:hypothetical protein
MWLALETMAWMIVSHDFGGEINHSFIGSIYCLTNRNYSSASLSSQRNDHRMQLSLEVKVVTR